ncbi:MAG: hypothetical protein FRX49_07960 [Trebouxia sp. A1-2]|nr:MAG: hypothetical protein FRX49_07960 [Trebouxia sp. A1-2]
MLISAAKYQHSLQKATFLQQQAARNIHLKSSTTQALFWQGQADLWMVLMTAGISARQSVFSQIDAGLPHAGELAQQADTGLHQLCAGIHGQSQRHRLKDDRMLSFVLVDGFGHIIACRERLAKLSHHPLLQRGLSGVLQREL